jgi:hypothetical protein
MAGHAIWRRETINAYKILVPEYEAKKLLERLRHRWEKHIQTEKGRSRSE